MAFVWPCVTTGHQERREVGGRVASPRDSLRRILPHIPSSAPSLLPPTALFPLAHLQTAPLHIPRELVQHHVVVTEMCETQGKTCQPVGRVGGASCGRDHVPLVGCTGVGHWLLWAEERAAHCLGSVGIPSPRSASPSFLHLLHVCLIPAWK